MGNKNKEKLSTSTKIVLASIIFTTIFTIVAIITQFITGEELSSTLITCVFAYWGVELGSLAAIKRKKLDIGYTDSVEEFYEENTIEEGVED